MFEKLSQKDKRALKLGAVCAAAIVVFGFATKWFEHWAAVRKTLSVRQAGLEVINQSAAKQKGLLTIVPAFEIPQSEKEQKFLFRDRFNEQLKKAGLKSKPLPVSIKKSRQAGLKLLCLKYKGKCKFEQALDLLANLKENPYLAGIEEFRIRCDPKKRQEVELDLTVSTFVKSEKRQRGARDNI